MKTPTEEQSAAILSAALEVCGSVSAARLKKAVVEGAQSSALVCPHALGNLAVAVAAIFPGGIEAVRKARIEREANERAARMAEYSYQRGYNDFQAGRESDPARASNVSEYTRGYCDSERTGRQV